MERIKEIHDFAVKYHNLYMNLQTVDNEVIDGFLDKCLDLGFVVDCKIRFIELYPEDALHNYEDIDKIIDDINDVCLLGSVILFHWDCIVRSFGKDCLLDIKQRMWFIVAFARLAILTEELNESTFVFQGSLQKIQLVSNNICYGPYPDPDDEVEQRLTITAEGGVWLSRYKFGVGKDKHELIEKLRFSVSSDVTKKIFDAVSGYFGNEFDIDLITDVGSWDLTLTNQKGQTFNIVGPLCNDVQTELNELSELIRCSLNQKNLFVFDGNSDIVMRIEVEYYRTTKIKPQVIPEGVTWDYVTWDYKEKLSIDRESETMEHSREIGSGCKVTNVYYIQDGIASFLNDIDVNALSTSEGDPPDAVDDPLDKRSYVIAAYTKQGNDHIIKGSFDKNGLPADWPDFINGVYRFISFYGLGELFDERIYGKPKRRKSDYIFCNVEFEDGYRTYCYLADTDEYCEGDMVVVPAGPDNHESVVQIKSIEYHSADDAPYPIEKTKHILRKLEG